MADIRQKAKRTPRSGVEVRVRGLSADAAKVVNALGILRPSRTSDEFQEKGAETVRLYLRVRPGAAEAAANAIEQMRRKLALLRAISESYPDQPADTLRVEVLDRDLSDEEITRIWGTDIAFRTRRYAKDGGR